MLGSDVLELLWSACKILSDVVGKLIDCTNAETQAHLHDLSVEMPNKDESRELEYTGYRGDPFSVSRRRSMKAACESRFGSTLCRRS